MISDHSERQHPNFPTHAEAGNDPNLVRSDHSIIVGRVPFEDGSGEELAIVSSNTLEAVAFSGYGGVPASENQEQKEARYNRHLSSVCLAARNSNADVIFLQETDSVLAEKILKDQLGENWTFIQSDDTGRLIAINTLKYRNAGQLNVEPQESGYLLSVAIQHQNKENIKFDLHNIYGKYHTEDDYDAVEKELSSLLLSSKSDRKPIIFGDTNHRVAPVHNVRGNCSTAIIPNGFNSDYNDRNTNKRRIENNEQILDFPDGGFYRDNQGNIRQIEIDVIDFETGEVCEDRREEIDNFIDIQFRILALDHTYQEEKIAIQDILNQLKIGEDSHHYSVTSNTLNEKYVRLKFNTNSNDYYYDVVKQLMQLIEMDVGNGLNINTGFFADDHTQCITIPKNKLEDCLNLLKNNLNSILEKEDLLTQRQEIIKTVLNTVKVNSNAYQMEFIDSKHTCKFFSRGEFLKLKRACSYLEHDLETIIIINDETLSITIPNDSIKDFQKELKDQEVLDRIQSNEKQITQNENEIKRRINEIGVDASTYTMEFDKQDHILKFGNNREEYLQLKRIITKHAENITSIVIDDRKYSIKIPRTDLGRLFMRLESYYNAIVNSEFYVAINKLAEQIALNKNSGFSFTTKRPENNDHLPNVINIFLANKHFDGPNFEIGYSVKNVITGKIEREYILSRSANPNLGGIQSIRLKDEEYNQLLVILNKVKATGEDKVIPYTKGKKTITEENNTSQQKIEDLGNIDDQDDINDLGYEDIIVDEESSAPRENTRVRNSALSSIFSQLSENPNYKLVVTKNSTTSPLMTTAAENILTLAKEIKGEKGRWGNPEKYISNAELPKLTTLVNATTRTLKNTNEDTVDKFQQTTENLIKDIDQEAEKPEMNKKRNWKMIMLGAMFIFSGALIITTSALLTAHTLGASMFGAKIGFDVLVAGFAVAFAAAGVLEMSAGAKFIYNELNHKGKFALAKKSFLNAARETTPYLDNSKQEQKRIIDQVLKMFTYEPRSLWVYNQKLSDEKSKIATAFREAVKKLQNENTVAAVLNGIQAALGDATTAADAARLEHGPVEEIAGGYDTAAVGSNTVAAEGDLDYHQASVKQGIKSKGRLEAQFSSIQKFILEEQSKLETYVVRPTNGK